jgi:hypothetical protein
MAIVAALPWDRHQSVPVAERGVLVAATVFLLPYIAWRLFRPVRSDATAALQGFVRRGDLPRDDETFDALTEHVVSLRRQVLPYRYAVVAPVPGLLVLLVGAAIRTDALHVGLAIADAFLWLGWAVALNRRERSLRNMEWLLGQPAG